SARIRPSPQRFDDARCGIQPQIRDRSARGSAMPVTAKLSKRFYEVLGEDVANELVNWFNEVDATYRADLRELNELNFARFDAKLEQRLAELRSEMEARFARADAKLEQRIMELRSEMEAGFARADAKPEQRTME